MKRSSTVGALLLVSAITSELQANPIEAFGFDPVDQGRAGTSVASGDLLSAASTNIAAASVRGRRFAIETGWTYHHLALELNGQRAPRTMDAHGYLIGVGLPFPYGPLELGAAATLWMPDQFVYRATLEPPGDRRFVQWENRPHRMDFHIGVAIRFFGIVHLGAALGLLAEWDYDVRYRTVAGRTEASINAHMPYRAQPQLSALITPTERVSIGVKFNFTVGQNYRLDFRTDGTSDTAASDLLVQLRGTDYWSPTQLVFGVGLKLSRNVRALAEGDWQQWSQAVPPVALLQLAALRGDVIARSPDGLGPTQYHDVIGLRAGVEADTKVLGRTLTLRGGYGYQPSPLPKTTGGGNVFDCDRHRFSAGASLELGEHFGLHFFAHLSLTWQHLVYLDVELRSATGTTETVRVGGNTVGGAATLSASF